MVEEDRLKDEFEKERKKMLQDFEKRLEEMIRKKVAEEKERGERRLMER